LFSFIREILKDVEDIEGDKVGNCHTFPILFGIANTKKLVTFLCIVVTICNIFYRTTINQTLTESTAPTEYLYYLQIYLLFVMLVSSTLAVLMWKIEKPKEFRYLSLLCKILLLSGVLAIPYIAYLP
jgi:4-hydroxybenzoate polyprenyltransferase